MAASVTGSSVELSVSIEASSDGRTWVAKSATPQINRAAITSGGTNVAVGVDSGAAPSGCRVRLKIWLDGTSPGCHLKLIASGRGKPNGVIQTIEPGCGCRGEGVGISSELGVGEWIDLTLPWLGSQAPGGPPPLPPPPPPGPAFVDPCIQDANKLKLLKQQSASLLAYLSKELAKAAPADKPMWAAEIKAIKLEIWKAEQALKSCCKSHNGKTTALATSVGAATFTLSVFEQGAALEPKEFKLDVFQMVFLPCWRTSFNVTNVSNVSTSVLTSTPLGDVSLDINFARGSGTFNPVTGHMAMTLEFAIDFDTGLLEDDYITFNLTTAGPNAFAMNTIFGITSTRLRGPAVTGGSSPGSGTLADNGFMFTGQLNLVGITPVPLFTPT